MQTQMAAADIEALSRSKGFLAQRLYVILTEPVNGLEAVQAASDDHLAHQVALERSGQLFAAGPLLTDDGLGCRGEGMIIVRANSLEEARAIAERDPMHATGARTYRIRPWLLNEGSLTLRINLSDQTGALNPTPP